MKKLLAELLAFGFGFESKIRGFSSTYMGFLTFDQRTFERAEVLFFRDEKPDADSVSPRWSGDSTSPIKSFTGFVPTPSVCKHCPNYWMWPQRRNLCDTFAVCGFLTACKPINPSFSSSRQKTGRMLTKTFEKTHTQLESVKISKYLKSFFHRNLW
jgi:hypothetical protein